MNLVNRQKTNLEWIAVTVASKWSQRATAVTSKLKFAMNVKRNYSRTWTSSHDRSFSSKFSEMLSGIEWATDWRAWQPSVNNYSNIHRRMCSVMNFIASLSNINSASIAMEWKAKRDNWMREIKSESGEISVLFVSAGNWRTKLN